MVIFDEFQHLIDSDTDRIAYRAADTVKTLLENNVCPLVMCGVSHAERVLHTNGQLMNRARPTVMMRPANWGSQDDQLAFRLFLNELEDVLGLPTQSGLAELGTAHRIHHVSRGLYGHASNLVREALLRRHLAGNTTSCITREQLAEAADGLLSREPVMRLNAFRTAPPERYDPAPMFEIFKESVGRRKRNGEAHDVDF